MRCIVIALLCILTLEGCASSSGSSGARVGSVAYGKIGGGGESGR